MTVDVQSPQFDLGELLGATFRLLKIQFVPLLKAFLPLVGLVVVVAGLFAAGVYGAIHYTGFYNPQKWDSLPMIIQAIGIGVVAIVSVIISSVLVISIVQVTALSCNGQTLPKPKDILHQAWGRVAAYWGTVSLLFLGALIVMIPVFVIAVMTKVSGQSNTLSMVMAILLFVAVPLWFALLIYLTFTIEVVALRGHSGMTALRSSYSLVKGRFWKTLGYIFVLGIVGWAVTVLPMMLIQGALAVVVPMAKNMNVVMIAMAAVMFVCVVLLEYLFFLYMLIGKTVMFLKWEQPRI